MFDPRLLIVIPVFLLSLSVHEFAHGYTAWKLGDPTAKYSGRLTLNPLKHIDPIGLIFALFFWFGWARPVPINPLRLGKTGVGLVALAGPSSNLCLCFVFALLGSILGDLADIFFIASYVNGALFFFNLLPIPPLDGSRVVFSVIPGMSVSEMFRYELYGSLAIIGIFFLSNIVGIPIVSLIISGPTKWLISLVAG